LPSSLLLFLLPLFPHLLRAMAKESAERLSSLAGPGVALTPNDSEFWAERMLLVREILVILLLFLVHPRK